VLLWLLCRMAAVAPIQPLARKLPYVSGTALKSKKKKKKKKISLLTDDRVFEFPIQLNVTLGYLSF